jgi:type IV pilus assembly protein PilW
MTKVDGKKSGFTLVEILVALALTGIVSAAVYKTFGSQQKVYVAQDQVAAMQQDLRAAADMMVIEIRMAGYDPTEKAIAGFVKASSNLVEFTIDYNVNGNDFSKTVPPETSPPFASSANDPSERITYSLSGTDLRRTVWSSSQALAENIDVLGFAYAYDNNDDGQLDNDLGGTIWAIDTNDDGTLDVNLDTNHDGEVNDQDNPSGVALGTSVPINSIRSVRIWILARSAVKDKDFIDSKTYVVADQRINRNDNYRRRLLTTTVNCRNMGLAK